MILIFQKKCGRSGEGGSENSDTCGRRGSGVKSGQKFADVLYGRPLTYYARLLIISEAKTHT